MCKSQAALQSSWTWTTKCPQNVKVGQLIQNKKCIIYLHVNNIFQTIELQHGGSFNFVSVETALYVTKG